MRVGLAAGIEQKTTAPACPESADTAIAETVKKRREKTKAGVDKTLIKDALFARVELLKKKLVYIDHDSFRKPKAANTILKPLPAENNGSTKSRPPSEKLDWYLARLYEVPLLSREQEVWLFRKMNYLKYLACKKLENLKPSQSADTLRSAIAEAEKLQTDALAVKEQIVEANLRLAFSIAKRYAGVRSQEFDDIHSDAYTELMHLADKFDFSRGNKFSTLATWAIMRICNRSLENNAKLTLKQRYEANDDSFANVANLAVDHRPSPDVDKQLATTANKIDLLLDVLDDRERTIIKARFALGESPVEAQTLKEVGEDLGLSKERVRQLEQRALQKLRDAAEEIGLDPDVINAHSRTETDSPRVPVPTKDLSDYKLGR